MSMGKEPVACDESIWHEQAWTRYLFSTVAESKASRNRNAMPRPSCARTQSLAVHVLDTPAQGSFERSALLPLSTFFLVLGSPVGSDLITPQGGIALTVFLFQEADACSLLFKTQQIQAEIADEEVTV